MARTTLAYRTSVRVGVTLAPLVGVLSPKLRAGHRSRAMASDRLAQWAEHHGDRSEPLVWFHAASVGEALQAESVMTALRRLRADYRIAFTHFSPSAEALAMRLVADQAADVADYLPYDTPGAAERLIAALAPTALVFSKLDLWPELASCAAARGTRVAIVAGTVSPGSGRLRWPARALLRAGYAAVDRAAAISHEDAERLVRLGVSAGRITVTGDPRYDSAAARVAAARVAAAGVAAARADATQQSPGVTLVAGSTWPADEHVLLSAFARIAPRWPAARLIIVPHEPTPAHLAAVRRGARRAGLPDPIRYDDASPEARLMVVDRTGILARLYGTGDIGYVGGGFGRAGLHSVLEPAAWGLPVLFGPRWDGSRDAGLLLDAQGARALPFRPGRAIAVLADRWAQWLVDAEGRQGAGRRALRVVEAGLGAAERTAGMLADLLSEPIGYAGVAPPGG